MTRQTTEVEVLYSQAMAADEAWQAALVRKFGSRAGTVRYTIAGRTGDLKELHAAFVAAICQWRNHAEVSPTKGCDCEEKTMKKDIERMNQIEIEASFGREVLIGYHSINIGTGSLEEQETGEFAGVFTGVFTDAGRTRRYEFDPSHAVCGEPHRLYVFSDEVTDLHVLWEEKQNDKHRAKQTDHRQFD